MVLIRWSPPPIDERIPVPAFYVPSFFLVLISSILFRNQRLRKLVITPVVISYLWGSLYCTGGVDADYQNITMLLSSALLWIDLGVLHNLEKHVFRTWEQEYPVSEKSFWGRLAWSYDLWTTWRGPGWNWQSRRSPRLPPHIVDKRSFIVDNIKRGIYCWIMSQTLLFLLEMTPYTRLQGRQRLQTAPLYLQIAVAWVAAIYTQYNMSLMYRIITSVLVATGVCAPYQCPPLFGSFRQMYTVNNLWSVCWQQMMRKPIILIPNLILSVLGFRGFAARYARLILAFVMSGAIHAAGAYTATRHSLGDMTMFVSQAVAIVAEDSVISLFKWAGVQKSARTILFGFIWTFLWFSFCLKNWIGELLWAGMLASDGQRSVLSKLLK